MTTTREANTPMSGGSTPSNAVYGSDYMVEVLRALGVKYIALNPGASYRGLHDSIVNFGSGGPEMVLCTHEEIAVAVANGYFRVTGEPIATGLHTSSACSTPPWPSSTPGATAPPSSTSAAAGRRTRTSDAPPTGCTPRSCRALPSATT